jgi:hypothetical protein
MIDYHPQTESEEKYEVFLFEPVTDQDNGTPISVLSALTRGNHDPWEEAARLARLPPDRAERELVELLNVSVGRKLSVAEMESAAKRLVPLLSPKIAFVSAASAMPVAADAARELIYWIVGFGMAVMLILVQVHDRASVVQSELPADNRSSVGSATPDNAAGSGEQNWIVNRAPSDHKR